MKKLSLNKIQLILLATLLVSYTLAILSYRIFIERPELEKSITLLSERVISLLILSTKKLMDSLSLSTRDHAAWTSTYNFMKERNVEFIEETLTEDTFANLKIDGFFLIDPAFNTVASFGFNHITQENLKFDFNDFSQYPANKNILPDPILTLGAPKKNGLIRTNLGVAIFSTVQIRDSQLLGEHRGWLVLLRLITPELFEELSTYILASVTYSTIEDNKIPAGSFKITDEINDNPLIQQVREHSYLVLQDINNEPLLLVTITHSNGKMPPLMDGKAINYSILLGLLVVFIYMIVNQYLVKPATSLSLEIKEIAENSKLRVIDKKYPILELQYITDNFNYLIKKTIHQTQLLAQEANIDQLTQLANRRLFEEVYAKQVQLFIRKKIKFALILADVDHFKKYNDALGHVAGDKALVDIAKTLQRNFPRQTDLCARFGGEEFIMLIDGINQIDLTAKLEDILQSFKTLNIPHPNSESAPYLTVSIGAYIVDETDVIDFDIPLKPVIEKVDIALYKAKAAGRNTFTLYSSDNDTSANTSSPEQ